jgi:hypothetical protein
VQELCEASSARSKTHRLDGALSGRDPVEALCIEAASLDAGDALGDDRWHPVSVGCADAPGIGVVLRMIARAERARIRPARASREDRGRAP